MQGELDGLSGTVRNAAQLPEAIAKLLFPRRLVHHAAETALLIPKVHLSRSVIARSADVSAFVADFFQATIKARPAPGDLRASTADLIRFLILRSGAGEAAKLSHVADEMGCSVATLRRRLSAQGTSFRAIKDDVLDQLAKAWLDQTHLTIEEIAHLLGYSDGFAFRRAFRRRNAISPLCFRQGQHQKHEAGISQEELSSVQPDCAV